MLHNLLRCVSCVLMLLLQLTFTYNCVTKILTEAYILEPPLLNKNHVEDYYLGKYVT